MNYRRRMVDAIALVILIALPRVGWGDVIPSRSGGNSREARSWILSRLKKMEPSACDAQMKELGARDLDYFVVDERRIQLAAGKPEGLEMLLIMAGGILTLMALLTPVILAIVGV